VPYEKKLDSTLRRVAAAYRDSDFDQARKRLKESGDISATDEIAVNIRVGLYVDMASASSRLTAMHCEVVFASKASVVARVPGGLIEAIASLDWIVAMSADKPGQFVPLTE
jgi:uncharacterized membrane protein